MDYFSVDHFRNELNEHLEELLNEYNLDEIEIYEEEGPGNTYYMGYVVKKDEKVYMINLPYEKNQQGEIGLKEQNWTAQMGDGERGGYHTLDGAMELVQ